MNLREALKSLFASGATEEDIRAQLGEARQDAAIAGYQSAGLLSADTETVAAARKLHASDPVALDAVLRAPRVAPPTVDLRPAAGPVDADPIAATANAEQIPYHEAAAKFEGGI